MKIVLFSGHSSGTGKCQKVLDILNATAFPRNRMGELVDLLEGLPDSTEDVNYELMRQEGFIEYVKEKGVVKMKDHNHFVYFATNGDEMPVLMTIDDVDVSKPWTIDCYDGAESVKTFDYEVIDKEINYVREKY